VNELDNRGSTFYLAMYWAQELAAQTDDAVMRDRFTKVARQLEQNENRIASDLLAAQGRPVDLGGYYHPDPVLARTAMRPSSAFNAIIETM
jgi:isocitrate dehydrogenase